MALVPPAITAMEPYRTAPSAEEVQKRYGLSRVIRLASNENPLGASPLALKAIGASLDQVHLYPTGGRKLREVLAKRFGIKVENVIAGSGSEGIMSNIFRTFLEDHDEVLTADATFTGFLVLAQSRGVACRTVPLRDWRFDLPALANAVDGRTKVVYLANPNNPTGTIFSREEFDDFYRRIPEEVLIILDEAYFEFAADNPRYPDSMHYRYDNVITLRTFSKAYGLAGLRIGYGFAHENLIANLLKAKLPFEPSCLAEAAGIAALSDSEFLRQTLDNNLRGMRLVSEGLKNLGITAVPSEANFILTLWPSAEVAGRIAEALLQRGVIVRQTGPFGAPNGIRIAIGSEPDNEILLTALRDVLLSAISDIEALALCS